MQWLKYILALLSLVGLWFVGLGLSAFIPLPASLLGLLVLLLGLLWLKRIPPALLKVSQFVLGHMLVLFVPATMGVLLYAEKLADNSIVANIEYRCQHSAQSWNNRMDLPTLMATD